MPLFGSDTLVRKALPGLYFFLSLFALIEIGISGYIVGRHEDYHGEAKSASRFTLFVALWTFIFGIVIGLGTLLRSRLINTGFVQFIYLTITLLFWIAVGAALQVAIEGGDFPHRQTVRACEWIGWIEVIFTALAVPWVMLGVAHAKEGIRGSVAV